MKKCEHINMNQPEPLMVVSSVGVNKLEIKYIDVPHEAYVRMMEMSYQPERLSEKNNLDLKNPLEPVEKMGFPKFEHSSKEMNDQWVLDPNCMR
jgi:hypothetical protein